MSQPETAETYIAAAIEAPQVADRAKAAIVEKAQIYGALYFFALAACLVLMFYAGWFRWVAGFLVLACLASAWKMRRTLAELHGAYARVGWGDSVLGKHRAMNGLGLILLAYSFLAVWRSYARKLCMT